jgi:DNA-directed RNA polymerase
VLTVCIALRGVAEFGNNNTIDRGQATATFRGIAQAIRLQLEYERWTKAAEADVLAAFRRRYPTVNRKVWQRWRRKVEAVRAEAWPESVVMTTGALLVGELVGVAPERFGIEMKRVQGRTIRTIVLSQETQEMLNDVTARAEVARPVLLPMIVPPLDWRYTEMHSKQAT